MLAGLMLTLPQSVIPSWGTQGSARLQRGPSLALYGSMLVAPLFLRDMQVELQCLPWTVGSSAPLPATKNSKWSLLRPGQKGSEAAYLQLLDAAADLEGR